MFTIQDLADGKCAIKNDGTLEELRKVLKLAFPNDFDRVGGVLSYYYTAPSKNTWWGNGSTSLPSQSVKDFLVDEFVLHEKWCIKVTDDNSKVIYNWLNANQQNNTFYDNRQGNRNLYIHFPKYDSLSHQSSTIIKGYTEISFKQFERYILKKEENMDNRFPFKLLNYDAIRIIDIACPTWKTKLANMWGPDIILKKHTIIEKKFYDEMRKACTAEQHKLFDNIFGKDDLVDLSILNDTDIFYMTSKAGFKYLFKGNPFIVGATGWNYQFNRLLYPEIAICSKHDVLSLRKATPEEIKFYNKNCIVCPYKNGELIWVKDTKSTNTWCLRYSTGKLDANGYAICYLEQRTSGYTNRWFSHQKAPGITLPK
jgi:hypothetical protein